MPDPVLDDKGRVGVQEPPYLAWYVVDISDLQTTADEVVSGNAEQGDAQDGVQVPILTRLCSEGGNEPHSQAPADVGRGAD